MSQPSTTMIYGSSYSFSPVPLFSYNREPVLTGDQSQIGETHRISLAGELIINSSEGSLYEMDLKQDALREAFRTHGQEFRVKCGNETVLLCYPRVVSGPNFAEGVWVNRSPFTIDLEFDEIAPSNAAPYIKSASEDWQLEIVEDRSYHSWVLPSGAGTDSQAYQLRLTHTVSAVGTRHYASTGMELDAWKQARNYVISKLGLDTEQIQQSGVINMNAALFSAYNHVRTTNVGEMDGSYSVTESWLLVNTGSGIIPKAIEDYNISIRTTNSSAVKAISIEGSVQGLETRNYGSAPGGFSITETKYTAASSYWNTVKDRLYPRASLVLDTVDTVRELNIIPLSTTIGHNITTGTITYGFEYDTRPSNCVPGALSETITITDNNQSDVFAVIPVIGKTNGPVLQDLNTLTAASREVSVEVVMDPLPTGCPSSFAALYAQNPKSTIYSNIITPIQTDLESAYSQVFKESDTNSWSIKDGRFSCNVRWTYQNC